MQRSAHKATASSPKTPNGPPSKKARLSNGRSVPTTPDHEIIQSAIDLEEKKRQEALDKAAQHSGETKWVLSFTDSLAGQREESLQVQQAGFAEIDAADDSDEDEEEVRPIRKKFGGGIKRKDVSNIREYIIQHWLTLHRSLSSSRKQSNQMERSHPLQKMKTTIATTPQRHLYGKRSAKSPQKIANNRSKTMTRQKPPAELQMGK
jgi:hypothetical protein